MITIVSPILNCAHFLPRMLRSVEAQEGTEIEHIVLDGGSTDGSVEIIQQYVARNSWARLIREPDEGQSDAINKGVDIAGGDIVTWLNGDDELETGALAAIVGMFRGRSGLVLVYGASEIQDESGRLLYIAAAREFDRDLLLKGGNFIPQPGSAFRRDAFLRVGGLRKSLHFCMDYDLWLRLSSIGEVDRLESVVSRFTLHAASKTTSRQGAFHLEHLSVALSHGATLFCPNIIRSCVFLAKHPIRVLATKVGLMDPLRSFIREKK